MGDWFRSAKEPQAAEISRLVDLHHAPGTRLLLERTVLLLVIDFIGKIENP